MIKKRQLTDYSTQKILNLSIDHKILISETGTAEKLKTTQKEFSSTSEALDNLIKKEWQFLKKGYVLNNPSAPFGEVMLHVAVSKIYTGAKAFVNTPQGIFIYKDEKDTDQSICGSFLQIDHTGHILNEIALPKALVWEMYYEASTQEILFNLDHEIFSYSLKSSTLRQLSQNQGKPFSFLSVNTHCSAFADDQYFYICNAQHETLQQAQHAFNIVNGNIPCCGQLSADGTLFALHDEIGNIKIIDTQTASCLKTLSFDFEMINDMQFIEHNQSLLFWEKYGKWSLRKVNLNTQKEEFFDPSLTSYLSEINGFCINQDQTRIAVVQRHHIHIIDWLAQKLIGSFQIQHQVRSCHIQFIQDKLAVRTDYGCFSLYQV